MKFEQWMQQNRPAIQPNTFAWYLAEEVWQARGKIIAEIHRKMNDPRAAGAIEEVGHIHD